MFVILDMGGVNEFNIYKVCSKSPAINLNYEEFNKHQETLKRPRDDCFDQVPFASS